MRFGSGRPWWWALVFPVLAPAVAGLVPPAAGAVTVCAAGEPSSQLVRVYVRAGAPELAAGRSALHCGTARYGFRHVVARHARDWAAVARAVDWVAVAEAATGATLARPDTVRCDRARNTCAFARAISPDVTAVVAVAREDGKIVTAYPARR